VRVVDHQTIQDGVDVGAGGAGPELLGSRDVVARTKAARIEGDGSTAGRLERFEPAQVDP